LALKNALHYRADTRVSRPDAQVGQEDQLVQQMTGIVVAHERLAGPGGDLTQESLDLRSGQHRPPGGHHFCVVLSLVQQVEPRAVLYPGRTS
jgi:hypothetical protein